MAETFGYTEKGGINAEQTPDRIISSLFTSGSAGTLEKMSLYLREYTPHTPNIKCAIYDTSYNLVANGTTEEKLIPLLTDQWVDFAFPTPPTVTATTAYLLAYWADSYHNSYCRAGAANQWKSWYDQAYDGWSANLGVPDSELAYELSIYATYTEAPPPSVKTLVQATLISAIPLIAIPTLGQIIKVAGG